MDRDQARIADEAERLRRTPKVVLSEEEIMANDRQRMIVNESRRERRRYHGSR